MSMLRVRSRWSRSYARPHAMVWKSVSGRVSPTDNAVGALAMVEPGTGNVKALAQSRHREEGLQAALAPARAQRAFGIDRHGPDLTGGATLRQDAIAGLNSAVSSVPDGMASGILAGRADLVRSIALQHLTSAHSSVIVGLLPAATAVFAVLRAGERPSRAFGRTTLPRCKEACCSFAEPNG